MKSTPEEIRRRFDADVDRFSNLETGQSATIDAPLVLDLISEAACGVTPGARALLDVGCGAGNYTLRLLQSLPELGEIALVDLSRQMLDRAMQRLSDAPGAAARQVTAHQADIRELNVPPATYDVIVAAAVLHHLREEAEWLAVFSKLYQALRPGGSIWISDLVMQQNAAVQDLMQRRYGQYLAALKDEGYRAQVFAYVEREDSPRPLEWQLALLGRVGFSRIEILHKHLCFAAFGAIK